MEKTSEVTTTAAAPAASGAAPQHAHRHDGAARSEHSKPHVTWDEETIAQHDLLRGTRQKIEEPNTPYHYYDHDADDAGVAKSPVSPARSLSGREGGSEPSIEWDELRSKLQSVQQQDQKTSEWDSSSGDEDDERSSLRFAARDAEGRKLAKDPKFAEKRKLHYNEFERVKAWRQSHASDDDEDDEDGDGNGAKAAHDTSVKRDAHASEAE